MAQDTRDVLMMLVFKGNAIEAESSAIIDDKDAMCKGFVSASKANSWKGNYFSLQDFNIELGLSSEESSDPQVEQENQRKRTQHTDKQIRFLMGAMQNQAQGKPPIPGRSLTEFPRFMQSGSAAMRTRSYSSDLEPVQISKQLDLSSLKLFDLCKAASLIDSATIVKRRGGGTDRLRTYLRIDFTEVLLTEFGWQDDDVVKETIKFVCRKAEVRYSVESPDGSQQAALPPGTWSYLNLAAK